MLAKHVEAQVFQHLQIVLHRLTIGRRVETIWPVALIKSSELEDELSVKQWTLDAVDFTSADRAESSVTANDIVSETHADVIEFGRVRCPQLWAVSIEGECSVGSTTVAGNFAAVGVCDLDLNICCGSVVGSVDSGVDLVLSVDDFVFSRHGKVLTRSIGPSRQLQLGDMIGRCRLNPHALPDTAAGSVENVRGVESLLADRNNIVVAVSRVMHEHQAMTVLVRSSRIRSSHLARKTHSSLVLLLDR